MSMFAFRASMFCIFLNYGMLTANWIGTLMFPSNSPQLSVWTGNIFANTSVFAILSSGNILQTLAMTAGVLALFSFSLLIPTIPFVFCFFMLSGFISASYIWQLHLPLLFTAPITMGLMIMFYVGASQYAARSSFSGS